MVPIRPVPKYPVPPALLVGSPVSHHHKYRKSRGGGGGGGGEGGVSALPSRRKPHLFSVAVLVREARAGWCELTPQPVDKSDRRWKDFYSPDKMAAEPVPDEKRMGLATRCYLCGPPHLLVNRPCALVLPLMPVGGGGGLTVPRLPYTSDVTAFSGSGPPTTLFSSAPTV